MSVKAMKLFSAPTLSVDRSEEWFALLQSLFIYGCAKKSSGSASVVAEEAAAAASLDTSKNSTRKKARVLMRRGVVDPWTQQAQDLSSELNSWMYQGLKSSHAREYTRSCIALDFLAAAGGDGGDEAKENTRSDMSDPSLGRRRHDELEFETALASFITSFTARLDSLQQALSRMNTADSIDIHMDPNNSSSDNKNSKYLSKNQYAHRMGIIACLLDTFQNQLVQPFTYMQKQRHRSSILLYVTPFALPSPPSMPPSEEDSSTSFTLWRQQEQDDVTSYHDSSSNILLEWNKNMEQEENYDKILFSSFTSDHDEDAELLDFIYEHSIRSWFPNTTKSAAAAAAAGSFRSSSSSNNATSSQHTLSPTTTSTKKTRLEERRQVETVTSLSTSTTYPDKKQQYNRDNPTHIPSNHHHQYDVSMDLKQHLEQETTQIQIQQTQLMKHHHSTTTTQRQQHHPLEQQMLEITALLTQFTQLITQQQEDVLYIQDSTHVSLSNVKAGKEQLIQASEDKKKRNKVTRHLFAWIIVTLAMTLLFFHFILP